MKLKFLKKSKFALIMLFLVSIQSCSVTNKLKDQPHIYIQKEGRALKKWKLVWQDEFNEGELDSSKWNRITVGHSDWNRHMSPIDDCFNFEDGKLILLGINNPDTTVDSRPFLTGGIRSQGKFAFQYGRVEVRAKLESIQGAWPAIWMLAELDKYGKYPHNGEIDIMEHLNFDDIIYHTTHSHYTRNLGFTDNPKHFGTAQFNKDEFNVFAISWYPDRIVFQLNGKDTFTYPRMEGADHVQWPYNQPFYLLIDQQLGGNWVGKVDQDQLPVRMIVDWVRVYQ